MKRNLILALIIAFSISQTWAQKEVSYPENLRQLHENFVAELLSGKGGGEDALSLVEKMNDQGGWPGIPYASKQRGSWEPAEHLGNLQRLAKAWLKPGTTNYHHPAILKAFHKGLNYWLENDFQCPNWWYPEIGVPMQLAPSLILMEGELSADQLSKAIKILDRAKIGMTGQNKVWLSGNVLMKSLLLRDSEMIRKASQSIQEEMKVGIGEGIQPDGSFHQHGPQIQFGNYGLAYVGDMIKWIKLLRNTPFAFDETKMGILRNYLLEGQQWISWKNQMDVSACGRQLFMDAQQGKARNLSSDFAQMEKLDPDFAKAYQKAGQFESLSGNKHFWRSDFQVQRTPTYYFSVKMCSERVIGAESCNSENIRGYYMGDGTTYLYQSGQEYENIFPYWNWKKIPGTTIQQDDKELPVLTAKGYRIESDFVGGVSDGKSGIAVMDYRRDGLTAKKSWFIFQDQIVCLGAGITSAAGVPVTTSLNQCYLNGEVELNSSHGFSLGEKRQVVESCNWVLHSGLGYFFPVPATVNLETHAVTGSWNQVALMYKNEPISAPIFSLWIDHGINPKDQSYSYCLIPNATKKQLDKLAKVPNFQIIANSIALQAVVSSDRQWGGAIFYKGGLVVLSEEVEVAQPCLLLLKRTVKDLTFVVSDPTQKMNQLKITLKGSYKVNNSAVTARTDHGLTELLVSLPKGEEAGRSVLFKISK